MAVMLIVIIQDLKYCPRKWDPRLNSILCPNCFKTMSPRMWPKTLSCIVHEGNLC